MIPLFLTKIRRVLPGSAFKSRSPFIAITLISLAMPVFASSDRCPGLLTKTGSAIVTLNVVSYLADLLKNQIIGDKELLRLVECLEHGKLTNPITPEDARVKSALLIHREALEWLLNSDEVDRGRLLEWGKQTLQARGVVRVMRETTRVATKDTAQLITFLRVEPRKFMMGEDYNRVEVDLTHDVEWMSTPVTQAQWVEFMGVNPSEFVNGEYKRTRTVNGRLVQEQPDNPVEQVTWWSAAHFANLLSIKHGLKPAYDFGLIPDWEGTPADGSWKPKEGQAAEKLVRINAPYGDIYRAEGYRFPTEAEQEDVLQRAWEAIGNKEERLTEIAWFAKNSNGKTHPVGELQSLVIGGREISDLAGNVWEWSHDYQERLSGGKNPSGPSSAETRIFRGGSWNYNAKYLRSASRHYAELSVRHNHVGFRLVRTLNPPPVPRKSPLSLKRFLELVLDRLRSRAGARL